MQDDFDPWSDEDPEWARYNYFPPQQDETAAPPQASGPPWTAANPPPPGSAPPGTNWMLNPTTGEFEPIGIGQMPPWGPRADQPFPPPATAPTPPVYPPLIGGGGGYQPQERRTLGSLNYPEFNAPTFTAPKPFSYEDFTLPTLEEAQKEPGFDFALQQGVKAYENSKAYLGTYRSGATIKGLNDYARNMATQNYGQVFDRKAQTYDRNRSNAADAYATNYGISRDVFDRNYTAAKDQYAPQARAAELDFARDWDIYSYEGDDDYRRWKAMIDANAV